MLKWHEIMPFGCQDQQALTTRCKEAVYIIVIETMQLSSTVCTTLLLGPKSSTT